MLLKSYIVLGSAVCLWFAVAAAKGWKGPSLGSGGSGFSSGSSSPGGGFFYSGGRSTSGSGGWGGGK